LVLDDGIPYFRLAVEGKIMRLNAPTIFIFLLSLVIAILALVPKFGVTIPHYFPNQEYWLAILAYVVLMIGNLVKGL